MNTTSARLGNEAKASFDEIYVSADPREYFSVLGSLDYAIPDLARPIFRQVASAFRERSRREATILDLGSSYGINCALFRYPLTFEMLRRRYARREIMALPSPELRKLDQHYFRSWPRVRAERLIAADISASAVGYAIEAGLADEGVVTDLERSDPTDRETAALGDVDIIVSTGCVGYVTEETFARILRAARRPPWVVSFCLRMFDYGAVGETLAKAGLVTEKLPAAAFVQRRFRDRDEARSVLELLAARGLDSAALEADGLLFAELFVSRPKEEVARLPLDSLLTIANGRNIAFGPRLMQVRREGRARLASIRG